VTKHRTPFGKCFHSGKEKETKIEILQHNIQLNKKGEISIPSLSCTLVNRQGFQKRQTITKNVRYLFCLGYQIRDERIRSRVYCSDIPRYQVTDLILLQYHALKFGLGKYLITPFWFVSAAYRARLVSLRLF